MKIQVDKWKKLGLGLSIVIILNLFFNTGIYTFYKMPEYDKYCAQDLWSKEYVDEASCLEIGGSWRADSNSVNKGWCDPQFKCGQEFNDANGLYNRNVFVILVGLGAITLILALFASWPSAVSNGLLYGGILSMIIGTTRYWPNMDDYLRFAVSGVVLVVLLALGIKKMKD